MRPSHFYFVTTQPCSSALVKYIYFLGWYVSFNCTLVVIMSICKKHQKKKEQHSPSAFSGISVQCLAVYLTAWALYFIHSSFIMFPVPLCLEMFHLSWNVLVSPKEFLYFIPYLCFISFIKVNVLKSKLCRDGDVGVTAAAGALQKRYDSKVVSKMRNSLIKIE